MRVEIPTCTRCCFCVPLRYGIIISGYLNLLTALMIVAMEAFEVVLIYRHSASSQFMTVYRGAMFYCQFWFGILLYSTEIIFSIILIVGAHMKRPSMLRAFYYYSMSTTLAVLVVQLVVRYEDYYENFGNRVFEFTLTFCGFVFQLYLWLLIRSELKKIKDRSRLTFVNHVSEIIVDGPLAEGRNPL